MSTAAILLLVFAAALGGALNSVVGGGSFVAFPALLFAGVPPVMANATTTMALWPGVVASAVAYRNDLELSRAALWAWSLASLTGGLIGAALLLRTSNQTFVRLIPWLLLFSTVLFSFGGAITARLRGAPGREPSRAALVAATFVHLLISIYGGFFGGGMGIMMMAAWSLLGMTHIHAMNGLRSVMGTLINGAAMVAFIAMGAVAWKPGLMMMGAATASGYFGAALARKLDPLKVKRFVLCIAWAMTIYFFVRDRGHG